MAGNIKRAKISLVALAMLLSSPRAFAYDSSGGVKTTELLTKVEFREGSRSNINPVLFPWDVETQKQFLERFRRVLLQIPLDVAQLPDINNIVVTNAACADEAPGMAHMAEMFSRILYMHGERGHSAQEIYKEFCGFDNADWTPSSRSMHFSGTMVLAKVQGRGSGQEDFFQEVVLHELIHAWEGGGNTSQNIPEKTKSFYQLRFNNLFDLWKDAQHKTAQELQSIKESEEPLKTLSGSDAGQERSEKLPDSCSNSGVFCIPAGLAKQIGLIPEDPRKQARQRKYYEEAYQALGLPLRMGGRTGRYLVLRGEIATFFDFHPMDAPAEYLASLAEMLWADPELAAAEYSPEEIAWVKHNLFKDRPIIPWRENAGSAELSRPKIDLSRQFGIMGNLHVDWAGR